MASSSGGKIRTKRTHSTRKPYERPKTLFTRVSETVKGLVTPSWISNLWQTEESETFEDAESGENDTIEATTSASNRNYIPSRRQHEIQNTEQEGNRYQEDIRERVGEEELEMVLQTPVSINRQSLLPFSGNAAPVETSTPVEDTIVITRRENRNNYRDDSSESSVSTSGCSSLVPHVDRNDHKEKMAKSNLDKLSELGSAGSSSHLPIWSETNTYDLNQPGPSSSFSRSNSPFNQSRMARRSSIARPQLSQPASKRPRFNASYFGTPRQEVTTPTEGRLHSPFYSGRTTFGGASAYRFGARNKPSPYEVHLPVKRHVKPKPARGSSDPDFGVTSSTAKKILNALDRMSTPLADAKRIPVSPTPSPFSFKIRKPSISGQRLGPPVSAMNIATTASVVPNIQPTLPILIHDDEKKDDTSVETEPMISREKKLVSSTPLRPSPTSSVQGVLPKIPVSQTYVGADISQGSRSGGKMKSSRQSLHYSATKNGDEEVVAPDLPNVALPIKMDSMPKFNFSQSSSQSTTEPMNTFKFTSNSSTLSANGSKSVVFSKASPNMWDQSKDSDTLHTSVQQENRSSLVSSTPFSSSIVKGNRDIIFKFSSPVAKDAPEVSSGMMNTQAFRFSTPKDVALTPSSRASPLVQGGCSTTSPNKKSPPEDADDTESLGGIKIAKQLKKGSCLEILGGGSTKPTTVSLLEQFKPPAGSWECPTCMIQNKKDSNKCVACETDNPSASSNSISLMEKFKPPPGSWECTMCMVVNKAEYAKCAACQTEKPGTSSTPRTSSLLDKFKAAPCMIRNKGTDSSCVACETPKPSLQTVNFSSSSLMDKFKPPPGSWECDTCMIQNKEGDSQCVACCASKPGAAGTSGFKFGSVSAPSTDSINSQTKTKSLAEMFANDGSTWECDTCMIQNKLTSTRCAACESPKPGTEPQLKSPPASSFKFGGSSVQSAGAGGGFKIRDEGSSIGSQGFQFGPASEPSDSSLSISSQGFQFGPASKPSDSSVSGGFQFGSSVKSSSKDASAINFQFGNSSSSGSTPLVGGFKFGESLTGKEGAPVINLESTESNKTAKPLSNSAFQLGTSTKPSTSLNGGFQFGSKMPNASEVKQSDGKVPVDNTESDVSSGSTKPPSTFNFAPSSNLGDVKTDEKNSSVSSTQQGFAFGESKLSGGMKKGGLSGIQFGNSDSKKLSEKLVVTSTVSPFQNTLTSTDGKSAFQFGTSSNESNTKPTSSASSAAPPTFNFGSSQAVEKKQENKLVIAPNKVSNIFQFGVKPNTNFSSTKGNKRQHSSQEQAPSGLQFSSAVNDESQKINADSTQPAFQFGKDSKTAFNFVASSSDQRARPLTFGSSAVVPKTNFDGSSEVDQSSGTLFNLRKQSSGPSSFGFGGSSGGNQTQPNPIFNFGAKPVTTSQQSSTLSFAASSSVSVFGAAPATSQTSSSPAFGSGTATVFGASSSTSSVFGNKTQAASAPSFAQTTNPNSLFGSTPNQNQTPSFGSTGSTAAPNFGGTTAFGSGGDQNSKTGFQFNTSNKAAFQFGQNNNATSSSSVQPSMFGFGAGNNNMAAPAPQPANGGFNFSASAPQTSFNFTGSSNPGGTTFQFSADKSSSGSNLFNASGPTSTRRIKKAVRRTKKS